MKTNISIELSDEERLNLGKKYYKKKKMITRYDLNELVKKYIYDVLEATPPTAQEQKQDPLLAREWSSLSQLKDHLLREGQTIITHFDGFQIVVKDKDGYHYSYILDPTGLHKLKTKDARPKNYDR